MSGRRRLRITWALAIGAAGGALFQALGLPLGWMLGAMAATMIASLARVPLAVPTRLRDAMMPLIGVFLGSSFHAGTLERIADWPLSLSLLVVFVPVATLFGAFYYTRVAGFGRITGLFSATPGGITAMILLGAASGGDETRIALAQGFRLALLVSLVPILAQVFDLTGPPATAPGGTGSGMDAGQLILLVTGTAVGIAAARACGFPAAPLTGAMLASATLHLSGLVTLALPHHLLDVALWISGASIGARFAGFPRRDLVSVFLASLGGMALLTVLTLGFAGLASLLPGVGFAAALLAFAPGGVAEMCLIANALDLDPVFVAFHHLTRIGIIFAAMPLAGRYLAQRGCDGSP